MEHWRPVGHAAVRERVANMRTGARLSGKVCVVTGAGSGIGRASALRFAQEGARLLAVDIDAEAGESTVAQVLAAKGRATFLQADVAQEAEAGKIIQTTIARYGRLDCLFNVVGVSGRRFGDGPAADCTVEAWDQVMATNLRSVFLCCKFALPELIASGGGSVINLSSVLGLVGTQEHFSTHAYAASKGGIIAFTRAVAMHYARDRVRANVIAPGLIETPMSRRAQESPEILAQIEHLQPITGRLGLPEDVAAAAAYLASDDAAFVTGVVLPVDGGWTAQ